MNNGAPRHLLFVFAVAIAALAAGCAEESTSTCSPVGFRSCEEDILTICQGDPGASEGTPEESDCTETGLTCKFSFTDRQASTSAGCVPEACQDPCYRSQGDTLCNTGGDTVKVCSPGVDANGNPVDGCLSWVDQEVCSGGTACVEMNGQAQCM